MDKPLLAEAFRAPEGVEDEELVEMIEEEPISNDTYGLLYVGHLTDTVQVGPHEIRIRTLKVGEELNAALLANRYKDTIEEGRALATALVSAAIVSVDGGPLTGEMIGPRDDSLESKFDYILKNWYWDTVRRVWDAYNGLLTRVQESADELKKD